MNIKGQGHLLTFIEGHSDSTFSNFFSLETARLTVSKFYMEPPWDEGMKVNTNGLCHMTKMAVMPMYGKTCKNPVFLNQKADDLEIWYATLVTQVLPNLFKWWPWVDLDLFYSKVKFGPFCFCMGKCL